MLNFSIMGIWTAGAVIVVGVIQWAKGCAAQLVKRSVPTWVWSVVMPLCAMGAALAFSVHDGGWRLAWNALGIWAVAQLGYEVIVKSVVENLFAGGRRTFGQSVGNTIDSAIAGGRNDISFSEDTHV